MKKIFLIIEWVFNWGYYKKGGLKYRRWEKWYLSIKQKLEQRKLCGYTQECSSKNCHKLAIDHWTSEDKEMRYLDGKKVWLSLGKKDVFGCPWHSCWS